MTEGLMARGRMLNQKIADDIEFNTMSIDAQFIFMRTIPHLDRDGLITGHPALLWSKVAPLLPDFVGKMRDIIQEWIDAGFVISYMDGKTPILFFPNFAKNQVGLRYDREPESEYAAPPGYHRTEKGLAQDSEAAAHESNPTNSTPPQTSGNHPDNFRQSSGTAPDTFRPKRREENTTTTESGGGNAPVKSGGSGEQPSNLDYAQVARTFENNGFGTLTAILGEEIDELLKEHPTALILEAMRVAVGANKRQLRYVKGILSRWRADGIDPLAKTPGPNPAQVKAATLNFSVANLL